MTFKFQRSEESPWSSELILLTGASFLAYANISVFFQFYPYLKTLAIDPCHYGLLIGVFSATSLLCRPLLSAWITADNGQRYLFVGTLLVIVALIAYSFANTFWPLFFVRILHGLSFVFMAAALMALMVDLIPEGHSSQVFGLISVVIMLPNTIVPPFWPVLASLFHSFDNVLLAFAVLTGLLFPLAAVANRSRQRKKRVSSQTKLGWALMKADLSHTWLWGLLLVMLFLYCGVALVFFFIAGLAQKKGLVGVGFFFTLTTFCEIGVRLAAGRKFDQWSKTLLITVTMVILCLGYVLLEQVHGQVSFYALAMILGLGWGVSMPLCNGLMFDWSEPQFRAFNTNLGLQMVQGGFFIGPVVGGFVLAHSTFETLYLIAAALALAGALIMCLLGSQETGKQRSPRIAP
jgi:predicted MFS family arabinose efflux permease